MTLVNDRALYMKHNSLKFVSVALAVSLIFVLFMSSFYTVNAAEGDEVRAAKKIVSVVYDDSSSMYGNRWSYANYSMQALIALMNEQDELYITFMTEPDVTQQVPLSSLQGSVDSIRDHNDAADTPEEALDTAMSCLDGINETDPTTQFWYIVMTDGEIADSGNVIIDIQSKLDSYKNKTMSNSTQLNVIYLGMCNAAPVVADPANHLYSYMPEEDSDIISAMQEISNLISCRFVADNVTVVSGNEIQVTSDLPLYSISILSQRSSASVTGASTQEVNLNVQRNISLDATDLEKGNELPTLYGNAAVINYVNEGEQAVIPAGTYTITFSDDVDISDITVQLEPAIGFMTEITRNGVAITATSELEYGDRINVRLIPVVPGTTEEIPAENLPSGLQWTLEYELNDQLVESVSNNELTDITLDEGDYTFRGTLSIPGFAPYIREATFNIVHIVIVYNFGLITDQPADLTYDRSEIGDIVFDQNNTVTFMITNDGIPLTAEEQDSLGLSLEITGVDFTDSEDRGIWDWLSTKLMGCELERNEDGSYSLIPTIPQFFFTTLFINDGRYTASVEVTNDEGITSEGYFDLVRNPKEDVYPFVGLFILLLFIYLLYVIFIKKKFRRQTLHYELWKLVVSDGSGFKVNSDFKTLSNLDLLVPRKACRYRYNGLILEAGERGSVLILGDSIAKRVERYGSSSEDPAQELDSIIENMSKTKKEHSKVKHAKTIKLTSKPVYFMDVDGMQQVWRIWID